MTLRCHCCGRRLKAYAVTVSTADGIAGYGPVCGASIARTMPGYAHLYRAIRAPPNKRKARIIPFYPRRDNVTHDEQLTLELE